MGNTHLVLLLIQICVASMEIGVVVLEDTGNVSTSKPSYVTLGHIPKGLYIYLKFLKRLLHLPVCCCSNHISRTSVN